MQQERGSPDGGAVHVRGRDAKLVRDLNRARRVDGRDAVDVAHDQPGIGDRVDRGLDVQLQSGVVRKLADRVGLGGTGDDDPPFPAHCSAPAPVSTGTVNTGRLMSPRCSNVTCSSISRIRSSGVFGTPTRLVIIRGPSASWTTA